MTLFANTVVGVMALVDGAVMDMPRPRVLTLGDLGTLRELEIADWYLDSFGGEMVEVSWSNEKYAGRLARLRFLNVVLDGLVELGFNRKVESLFPSGKSEPSSSVKEEAGAKGTGDGALRGIPMGWVGDDVPEDERRCKSGTVEWWFVLEGLRAYERPEEVVTGVRNGDLSPSYWRSSSSVRSWS